MPLNINASNFAATLTANYTLAALTTFVAGRFSACGFPSPTTQTGTTNRLSYDLVLVPSVTFGAVRFVVSLSILGAAATIQTQLFIPANYNNSTFVGVANSGANVLNGTSFTLTTTNPVIAYAIPTTIQMMGVVFHESGTTFRGFAGIAAPVAESWWDHSLWIYPMLINSATPTSFFHSSPSPSGAISVTPINARIGIDTFSGRNPANNLAQVVPAPLVTSLAGAISGVFNTDIGLINNSGYNTNDTAEKIPGVEEYWNVFCPTSGNGGLCIRSV